MSNVADSLRRRVLSHTESSMTFAKNELLSLCEAIDTEVRQGQERMRERAALMFEDVHTFPVLMRYPCAMAIRALEVEDGNGS